MPRRTDDSMTMPDSPIARQRWRMAAAAYLLFVVYGSLVPFEFRALPPDQAWRAFLDTPFLALGVASRADWVANGILYLALGFLLAAAVIGTRAGTGVRLGLAIVVLGVCEAVAFGIEFVQLFFPPRTVSLNDLLAETIGSVLGVAAWLAWGHGTGRMAAEFGRGGVVAIRAAAVLYVLAYLALSLFPYDLLVSAEEYARKLAQGGTGWLLAPASCRSVPFCAAKLGVEILSMVPAGILLGMALGRSSRAGVAVALVAGTLLGGLIEVAQLAIASGTSQGLSVVTRAVGMALGVTAFRHTRPTWLGAVRPWLPWMVAAAALPYLLVLLWANGWVTRDWADWAHVRASLAEQRWLPLYYHYFTTETGAVVSVLACVVSYGPVGLAAAALCVRDDGVVRGSAWLPAALAGVLAALVEAGKLALPGRHPDPSNVFIAMAAAGAGFAVARLLLAWSRQGTTTAVTGAPAAPVVPAREGREVADRGSVMPSSGEPMVGPGPSRVVLAIVLLAGTGMALRHYPLGAVVPGIALAAYAAVLWRFPRAWLVCVLAALPALNLMPLTGWVLIDEFDLLLAVSVAVVLLRPRAARPYHAWTGGARVAVGLLLLSFVASAAVGFVPVAPFDSNAVSGYFSGYNSLRILKGFLWPLALWLLIRDEGEGARDVQARFVAGVLLGLCVVIAVSLWQRIVFGGLFSFSSDYRIEGPFPELHTGGGDLHGYLVLTMPFAAAAIALWPRWIIGGICAAVFAASGFVLAVTFTRGAYVGGLGALVVVAVAFVLSRRAQGRWRTGPVLAAGAVMLAGTVIAVPVVMGTFMKARISASGADAKTRIDHWLGALRMRDPGIATSLFGMGLGSFPRTFLIRNPEGASASVSFQTGGGEQFARLGTGRPTYFSQRVAVEPGGRYVLSFDLRGSGAAPGRMEVFLCEKSEHYSFDCRTLSFPLKQASGQWARVEGAFDVGQMGAGRLIFRRPIVLSFMNAQAGTLLDIDNVRLADASGRDLVSNGDFARGSARWFFATDDHLPWHVFSTPTQVLFELGWFGVGAVAIALLLALGRTATRMWRGDLFSGAVLAALVGFLLVGITESLFDGPRVMVLFFLVVFLALRDPGELQRRSRRRRSSRRRSAVAAA
jgi:VanZ family protein